MTKIGHISVPSQNDSPIQNQAPVDVSLPIKDVYILILIQ